MGLQTVDEIERSFLAHIERGEQALQSAENDCQRLAVREGLSYNELRGFRSAHNSLTDEEFEELAGDDTGEPMTRRQLREIAREKRALALEPENEVSENQAAERNPGFLSAEEDGPDAFEEIVGRMGGQVRDNVAQLTDRLVRVLGVIPYTVWDFPFRGDYAGDKNHQGNCSPHIIEQCVWRLTGRYRRITLADAGTVSDRSSAWRRCPDWTSRAWG